MDKIQLQISYEVKNLRQASLFDYEDNFKVLIITSCSKKKLNYPAIAANLYQGTLFKKVKKFAKIINADFKIISAKHGLIDSQDKIEPYDQEIENISDIRKLRKTVEKLQDILSFYDKIIIIMGKKYRKIFSSLFENPKIILIKSNKGIGGYLQLLDRFSKAWKASKIKPREFLNILSNYSALEASDV